VLERRLRPDCPRTPSEMLAGLVASSTRQNHHLASLALQPYSPSGSFAPRADPECSTPRTTGRNLQLNDGTRYPFRVVPLT
jgi:hypothetical protein